MLSSDLMTLDSIQVLKTSKLTFPPGPLSSPLGSYLQLHTFEFPLTYVIGLSNTTWPKHFPCFLPTWIYLLLFQTSTSQQVAPPANQWLQQKLLDSSQISSTLISNLPARYVGFSPEAYSKFVPLIFHYFHPNLSWAIIVTHFSSTHSQSPPTHNTTIYSSHANRKQSSENWNLLSFSWGKSASGFLLQQELKLNRGSCLSQDPTWSSPTVVLEHVTLLPSTLCAHCPSAPWISGIYSDLSDLSSTGSSDFISELISSEWPSLTLLSKSRLICLATTPLSYGPPVWHVPLTDVTALVI